jgi:hypothetical protein
MVDRKAGGDRAAEHMPDESRRRGAGVLDQLAEPGDRALDVERVFAGLGGAVTG